MNLAKELREDGKYKFLSAEEDVASIKKEKNIQRYILNTKTMK